MTNRSTAASAAARARALSPSLLWGAASVLLLTLASAPFGQWYLAWIALVPLLVAVQQAQSARRAALVGYLAGAAYFALNLWWLWTATVAGTVVLVVYLAVYWALFAWILHRAGLLVVHEEPPGAEADTRVAWARRKDVRWTWRILLVAAVWVGTEWLRSYVIPGGFPWLPLGSTQTPIITMCQVADLGGPWIVSFWLLLPNMLVVAVWSQRHNLRQSALPAGIVALVLCGVGLYGAYRIQFTAAVAGPRVMVFQSNFPHLPGGAPTIEQAQAVDHYFAALERLLAEHRVDLAILPESAFPPINEEARRRLARSTVGPFLQSTHERLRALARDHRTAILVGGTAVTGWTTQGREHIGTQIRNSAYLFDPSRDEIELRYDKIHLVPFSERPAFDSGPAWLRRLAMAIAASRAKQPMYAGRLEELRPFRITSAHAERSLATATFIAPICLENIDPRVVARMVRDPKTPQKQADFIANLSNDGWFNAQQRHQHWQTTILRCIETRTPMARSSNTGISGFVDSCGRPIATIAPSIEGASSHSLLLDDRLTAYMQFGDAFALTCLAATAVVVLVSGSSKTRQKYFAATGRAR